MRYLKSMTAFALSLTLALAASAHFARAGSSVDPDADYDRLDGTGKSGKTVQVIEWEGNLEIHVYPPGSLRGLALKLDKTNKNKPVMVIGYRFADAPKEQLIRRAILGINLQEGFKTYKDPSEGEFDKIVISNNGLSGQVVAFALDPEPRQLYPDGHPALAQSAKTGGNRAPASITESAARNSDVETGSDGAHMSDHTQSPRSRHSRKSRKSKVDEGGAIRPFFMDNAGSPRSR
jgi:hypothetical protein